jgi:preprotein translocase subunit SecE
MEFVEKLKNYFIGSYQELTKVTWPTKKQTINYSLLVIIMSVAVALFFGILDFFLNIGISKLI